MDNVPTEVTEVTPCCKHVNKFVFIIYHLLITFTIVQLLSQTHNYKESIAMCVDVCFHMCVHVCVLCVCVYVCVVCVCPCVCVCVSMCVCVFMVAFQYCTYVYGIKKQLLNALILTYDMNTQ